MRQNSIIFHTSLSDTPTTVGISLFRFSHTCLIENHCALRVGDEMKEILAERLKQCRKERGFSQRETAIYCDITEKAYQNYELMTREPKLDVLIRIADLFEVSLDYLTGRTDNRRVNP